MRPKSAFIHTHSRKALGVILDPGMLIEGNLETEERLFFD